MKKLIRCIMILTLALGCFIVPKSVYAANNNDIVSYKISMPINYLKVDTSDIKEVTLHYGVNGWKDIKDVKMDRQVVDYYMGRTFEAFQATVYVKKGSTVDYCFKQNFYNKGVIWDNNDNRDYHVFVERSNN